MYPSLELKPRISAAEAAIDAVVEAAFTTAEAVRALKALREYCELLASEATYGADGVFGDPWWGP